MVHTPVRLLSEELARANPVFALGDGYEADGAVADLRPHARVLLPTADGSDVVEALRALRA